MKWSTLYILGLVSVLLFSLTSPVLAGNGLVGTSWRVVLIDGKPVIAELSDRQPHLVFTDGRVSGSTGCNRFTGAYEHNGNNLRFGQMATTKMACPPAVSGQEQKFLQALGATAAMQLSGSTLELQDSGGQVLMRLEAR